MPGDRLPWFKCFPGDILTSARVGRMSPTEFGAYMKLLLHCYNSSTGSISGDMSDLLFYVGRDATQEIIQAVLPMFKPAPEEGKLTHEHIEANRRLASNLASRNEERSDSGRKGGLRSGIARRGKKKEAVASEANEAKIEARSTEQNRTDQSRASRPSGGEAALALPLKQPTPSPASGSSPRLGRAPADAPRPEFETFEPLPDDVRQTNLAKISKLIEGLGG